MAYFANPDSTKQPERSDKDYLKSSRSQLVNHLKTEVKKVPGHDISDFLTQSLWSWIYHYVKSRFGRKYPYTTYELPETGVYDLPSNIEISIAITSDWATDTADSFAVAEQMKAHNPDYTIHVGDTYYVGAPAEIISNFVEPGSPWVRGLSGSFAVLGNHEMYARGTAFFKYLLPTLGMRDASGAYTGQKAGFFCLQNEHWRILGLDTGYHSTGTPLIEFIPGLGPDCHFDDKQLEWLEKTVGLGNQSDKRGILIFTHHQFITAFTKESEYSKPARQLATLLGPERTVVWLWGHEHKLSVYGKKQVDQGLSVYGRCIGNGGTPVEVSSPNFTTDAKKNGYQALVAVDDRLQKTINGRELGYNGYVVLKLNQATLRLDYYDNTDYLFTEQWTANNQTGRIEGTLPGTPTDKLKLALNKSWAEAVK